MPDIITDFANEGIRHADRIIDELDEFMKKLEDAGILSGWTQFMEKEDGENGEMGLSNIENMM